MSITITFDETSIFCGFSVSLKITNNDDMSKTMILAETYRRLEMCLESLHFEGLRKILRQNSFVVNGSIDKLQDGDTIKISCLK